MRIENNNNWRERLEEHLQKETGHVDYDAIWDKIQAGRNKQKPVKKRAMWMYYAAAMLACILLISILMNNDTGEMPNGDPNAGIKKEKTQPDLAKNKPANNSTGQPISKSTDQPGNQSSNQRINQSTDQPINQSTDQLINQAATTRLINQSTNQPINQSTDQPVNHSTDQLANQSTSQPLNTSTTQPESPPVAKTRFPVMHINEVMPPSMATSNPENEARRLVIKARDALVQNPPEPKERIIYTSFKE